MDILLNLPQDDFPKYLLSAFWVEEASFPGKSSDWFEAETRFDFCLFVRSIDPIHSVDFFGVVEKRPRR